MFSFSNASGSFGGSISTLDKNNGRKLLRTSRAAVCTNPPRANVR